MSYYSLYVKDRFYKQLLTFLNVVGERPRDCILCMALHVVIKPTYRYTVTQADQEFCRKATIEDSVSSAVLYVTGINDVQNLIETLNRKSVESNSPIQPFIIVVGVDISNLVEFYVSFKKSFYKLNS
ncbi:uncharacterized protein LOC119561983 [Drosophila subpulchrella]|uniref:uncharacterized protein LOC119561983 n=1 Tax=Drosophila subpulchrella TaxID=1486046 RepID=UPI0018A17B6A|nr:uncharacterized protein LOC119561983 [Drosophila subpulchrella]